MLCPGFKSQLKQTSGTRIFYSVTLTMREGLQRQAHRAPVILESIVSDTAKATEDLQYNQGKATKCCVTEGCERSSARPAAAGMNF